MMQSSDSHVIPVVVGTAGHIDHGKTSLVRRLTGIDTDRLPEERKRGISIDLGFAYWRTPRFHFGVVDVPGHERFIKTMVAGAASVDLALLVVAADDGVMPQTREHLSILDLLGIRTGVVAITKIDLVPDAYQDLVEDEIRELIRGSVLEGSRIVRVSSTTGRGMEELQQALCASAADCEWASPRTVFRMPIDQVFTKSGQGTVVTGTVLSGTVCRDDIVEMFPSRVQVRVRSVQHHGSGSDQSGAHRRTGLNLAGVKRDELRRGNELATPGYLRPTQRMLVSVRSLKSSPLDLKDRMSFRLHMGTEEVGCRIILKGSIVTPGASGIAELRVDSPVVAEYGQRFILRRVSPPATVAGGTILDPELPSRMRIQDLPMHGRIRQSTDAKERLEALLAERMRDDLSRLEMSCRTGIAPDEVASILADLQRDKVVQNVGSDATPIWVHATQWARMIDLAQDRISKLMIEHQPRRTLPLVQIANALRQFLKGSLLGLVPEELLKSGWMRQVGDQYGPAALQIQLSKRQQDLRREALQRIIDGGLAPPSLKEMATSLQQPVDKLESVVQLDVDDQRLAMIAPGLYYDIQALEQVRQICVPLLANDQTVTVAQLRDAWQVSRKHSIPLCEWLDSQGITQRAGDQRHAGPNLQTPLSR